MARIPRNFIAVDAAKSRKFQPLNVMGLVVDALPPRQTGGSSFGVTFTIKDCDFTSDARWGLKVRFFRDRQADLPSPNVGDVVLLRMIQVRDYQGAPVAFSAQRDTLNPSLAWSIFKPNPRVPGDLLITNSKESPSPEERAYALSLLNHESHSGNVPAPAPVSTPINPVARRSFYKDTTATPGKVRSPASNLRRFSLLQDLECWRFADIVGQVVKTFPASYDRFTLYVTDYTTHKDLFNYSDGNDEEGHDPGDPYGYISRRQREWPGPFGRMTIQVTLFEPHASFAKVNVNEGDFVCLRNMQVKMDNVNGLMEGVLRTDRMYPDKISVSVIPNNDPDEHVRDVVRRKTAYWKKIKADKRQSEGRNKRQLSDTEGNSSRKAQKTRQKDKRKGTRNDDITTGPPPKREQLNLLVRAAHPAIPCTSIRDIVSDERHKNSAPGGVEYILPFQNLRYRASVRVVDFFPPKLEDFAVKCDLPRADDDDSDSSDSGSDSSERPIGWEWRFCLLVQDSGPGTHYNRDEPKERMKLFVAGSDAEFLLKLDATNLRENAQTLAELREKLFILWGNLEECKSSNPDFHPDDPRSVVSSRPFVCCIKEYGVPTLSDAGSSGDDDEEGVETRLRDTLGWERRFRMFETTLLC